MDNENIAPVPGITGEFMEPPLNFFLNLFSTRQASLIKRPNGNWRPMSLYYFVSDEEVIASISGKDTLLRAFALGTKERFYVMEILQADVDLDPLLVPGVINYLQKLGAKARAFRAACSDVVQIFLYFDAKIKTNEIADWLNMYFHQASFDFSKVRILKEDDCFALPLIEGFEFLNENYEPVIKRQEIALEPALALFMTQLVKVQTSSAEFRENLRKEVQKDIDFSVPENPPPKKKTRLIQLALPVLKPVVDQSQSQQS